MTDFCPACGYYLYDGECQGCGSMFTEEALRSMSKVASKSSLEKIYDGVRNDGLRHVLWGDHTSDYSVIHWIQSPDTGPDRGYTHVHRSENEVKECLRSGWPINKESADIDQFPSPQEHAALTNSGWYQHSKELGDPYPVYYKNGSKYLHILQYKPRGENNWHLEHMYPGGMLPRQEGPPLPEPTSHSRLVGEIGENTVGERLKKINVDRETSPVYDPYIPSPRGLFERLNSQNPGVFRFSDSTKSEDLIYDGPVQQPSWFAVPEYDVERVDPTEDTSKSVKTVRDADVSVENGAPGRLASKQKAVGDRVHAHCPEGHSGAIKVNENAYRCVVCGKQWVSKNSSVPSPRDSLQSEGWDYRGRFRTPIGVGDRYMKSGSIFRGLQTVHEITHASSNGGDLFKYRVGLLLPSNKSVSWLPDEHFGHSSETLDSIRSKISQNESRFKDTSEIKKTVPMSPKDTIDLARRMNEPKGSLGAPIHTLSWQSIGQSKGNQGDGLNFSGLRPGNWQRKHGPDSQDGGLESGWRDEEPTQALEIESSWKSSERKWRPGELRPEDIDDVITETLRRGTHPESRPVQPQYEYQFPDWDDDGLPDIGDNWRDEDARDRALEPAAPEWVRGNTHRALTGRLQFNWDGEEYTRSGRNPRVGGGGGDYRHTLTPHPDGSWEHAFEINPPGDGTSHMYFGHHQGVDSLWDAIRLFDYDASRRDGRPSTLSGDPSTLRRFFRTVPGEYGAEGAF